MKMNKENKIEISDEEMETILEDITLSTLNLVTQKSYYNVLRVLPVDTVGTERIIVESGEKDAAKILKKLKQQKLVNCKDGIWYNEKATDYILEFIETLIKSIEREAKTLVYKHNKNIERQQEKEKEQEQESIIIHKDHV